MNDDFNSKLVLLVQATGYEAMSYSGRGMYDKYCVGVKLEQGKSAFRVATEICLAALDIIADKGCNEERTAFSFIQELSNTKVAEDSLGMDSVLYFPDVEWPEGDE